MSGMFYRWLAGISFVPQCRTLWRACPEELPMPIDHDSAAVHRYGRLRKKFPAVDTSESSSGQQRVDFP